MSDQNNGTDVEQEGSQEPPLLVNAQYIKDLSFENPMNVSQLNSTETPNVSINIEVRVQPVMDRSFEVLVHVQVEAARSSDKVFLLELDYAGIFTIGASVPEEYVRPILMVECPRLLFPFARGIVASIIQEAGYPAIFLNPVDFAELFQRQLMEEQAAQTEKNQENPTVQ